MHTIEQLQQLLEAAEQASLDSYYQGYYADQLSMQRIQNDMTRTADLTYSQLSPQARSFADRLRGDIASARNRAW